MEIVLIRHFMTQGNADRRYIGTTDEPLLPGQAVKLPYPDVQMVVVSPLKRCTETADLIYPGVKRYICSELRECDFGLFENKNYEQLKDHPVYQAWISSGGRIPFPGGEGREAFRDRCVKGFCDVVEMLTEEGCGSAAFVVHGGTIMSILDRFAPHEEGFYHWQVRNGEGYRVRLDEEMCRNGTIRLDDCAKIGKSFEGD